MEKAKQYVVLEHLMLPDRGFRFFSANCHYSGNHENNTHGYNGEEWYKEVGFADTIEEAQGMCSPSRDKIPTWEELYEYHREESNKSHEILQKRLEEDS